MHYLCQECQTSVPKNQLFLTSKQIGGETKMLRVCPACKKKHEEELEMTRQNFQTQFGEKPAVLQSCNDGKSTITPIVDIHKIIDDAMEKKDRSVVLYIGEHGTSVYVNPYKDDKVVWKGTVSESIGRANLKRRKKMYKLYYIRNTGCDDETYGLVRISDEDFPKFKAFVENLNKNSRCGCQPTISVYKIDPAMAVEIREEDVENINPEKRLYLEGKVFYFLPETTHNYSVEDGFTIKKGIEQVI